MLDGLSRVVGRFAKVFRLRCRKPFRLRENVQGRVHNYCSFVLL